MTDIVERLKGTPPHCLCPGLRDEAADEITRLRALNAELQRTIEVCAVDYAAVMEKIGVESIASVPDILDELRAEVERLKNLRRPCECSEDDQCMFAKERDGALQEVDRLRGAVKQHYEIAFDQYAPSRETIANMLHDVVFGTTYSKSAPPKE